MDGLPAFVDDFYVYGPLRENEIVRVRGRKPACTTGEEGSGKRVVSQISLFVRQVWGCKNGFKNVSIAHTVYANSRKSRIIETIEKIEKETGYRARRRWNELYQNENPAAYFVTKVDVSELPMEKLQKGLPAMRRLLMSVGCGLYQIDYTQDFSGTLVRPALVQYLVRVHDFFQQGQFAFPENGGCNLDNTDSVGDHVCTFVQTRNGRTASTKFYNKVVCQFEAVDVRESFGGHLAHYIDSTNRHLRWTMLHPDVQRRGCTRLEISLYACDTKDLSQTVAEELIAEALELANTEEGLFVVQPPAKQWENLAQHLTDACCWETAHRGRYISHGAATAKPAECRGCSSNLQRKRSQTTLVGREQCNGLWGILAHISRGDCGRGRWRGAIFASSLLHKSRANHSCQRAKGRASCIQARPTHKIYYRQQGM